MVVVVDDEDRENEGDLVMAAEDVTPESVAFFLQHTSGYICAPIEPERADELDLPLMVLANTEAQRTAFTVSVDLSHGTTTGISAKDRAATVRALADPSTVARDFNRPGHIFPLCATGPVACSSARGTPRRPSTCAGWRAACPRACSASS